MTVFVIICKNCGIKSPCDDYEDAVRKSVEWEIHAAPRPGCHADEYPWQVVIQL